MERIWIVPATVVRVVDGDTVKLALDLGWHVTYTANCRIVGINAPEIGTPPGVRAKQHAETLLAPGDAVTFASHTLDKYGRPLGNLYHGVDPMRDFGEDMIESGHAIPYGPPS